MCGCGNRGCVEALCLEAVARGEWGRAARVLGEAAANLVGLLDVDLVLLGGRTVAADPSVFVRGVGPSVFVRGVGEVLAARDRREGGRCADAGTGGAWRGVPVRVASGGVWGVAEGAAQLLLAPVFGRGEG